MHSVVLDMCTITSCVSSHNLVWRDGALLVQTGLFIGSAHQYVPVHYQGMLVVRCMSLDPEMAAI